jgi:glycerophosphoryl diester phosphodiesterase
VISFVKEQGMEREVVLKGSFAPNALKQKITDDFHAVETGKLCYMPILQINQPRALQEFEAWQKLQRQPFAYELCFSRETPCDVLLALQKLQGSNGPRIWINTLWDSLCAGHTDERGHKGDPEGSWGWCLRQGATMIQTDRPVELIEYLKGKGRRNL